MFRALDEIIERDVREANRVAPESQYGQTAFEFERNPDGITSRIQVRRTRRVEVPEQSVTFEKQANGIKVSGYPDVSFHVIPNWDAESASCKLQVDGTPHEPWQVSQRALEKLFFPET